MTGHMYKSSQDRRGLKAAENCRAKASSAAECLLTFQPKNSKFLDDKIKKSIQKVIDRQITQGCNIITEC